MRRYSVNVQALPTARPQSPATLQATGLGAADCSALRKVARSC